MNEKFYDHPVLKELREAKKKSKKLSWRLNHEVYKDLLTIRERLVTQSKGGLEITLELKSKPIREGYVSVKTKEFVLDDPFLLKFIANKAPHFSVRPQGQDYCCLYFSHLDVFTCGDEIKIPLWRNSFDDVYKGLTNPMNPSMTYRLELKEEKDGSKTLCLYDTAHYDDWDFLNNLLYLCDSFSVRLTGVLIDNRQEIELKFHIPKDK